MIGLNDGGGLKEMSDNIPGGEFFSWQDEDKIIDEINRRSNGQPIVLVGHGMGGDTAVSISKKLNSASHGFKKIDLLVTLDSVGFNNDIIPQNVKQNLNFITDGAGLFNDAPNIARKADLTEVENFLQSEDHDELVESSEVQFKIFDSINDILFELDNKKQILKESVLKETDKAADPEK